MYPNNMPGSDPQRRAFVQDSIGLHTRMNEASGTILLCADSESLIRPWMMGLSDIELADMPWLKAFSKAQDIRAYTNQVSSIDEVWVVSADDIEAVNLAAALRKDNVSIPIVLVLVEASGSTLSRANAAGVSSVLTSREFQERFMLEVHSRRSAQEADAAHGEGNRRAHVAENSVTSAQGTVIDKPPSIIPDVPVKIPVPEAIAYRRVSSKDRPSFILSVVSGSGGAGKSVVSAMMAFASSQTGARSVLIDCDLQFGDLKELLGKKNAVTVDDVIGEPSIVAKVAQEAGSDCPALIAAPPRLENSEILGNHIGVVIDECTKFFDNIIINTGSCWTETHAVLLEQSTSIIFLIDQRASSIYAAKHAIELCQRLGIAMGSFIYCLNRCAKNALFSGMDIACVMNGAQVLELKDGGIEVEELAGAGYVSELMASKNDLTQSLLFVAELILPDIDESRRKVRTHIKADPMNDAPQRGGMSKRKAQRSQRRRSKRNKRLHMDSFAKRPSLGGAL